MNMLFDYRTYTSYKICYIKRQLSITIFKISNVIEGQNHFSISFYL